MHTSNCNTADNFMTPDKWNRLSFLKLLSFLLIMIFHLDNSFNGVFSHYIPFFRNMVDT